MRDLFRPINKENNNQSIECKSKEEVSSCVYSNIDSYIECQEESMYDVYYQDHRDQSELEEFLKEMELIGVLII